MESGHLDGSTDTDALSKPESEDPESEKPCSSKENEDHGSFDCNICLEMAKDAVISMCGHLFCWPCLLQWLETRPNRQLCPVCKSGISKEKVIPLYGRNGDKTDPREKIAPRPRGQRTEAPQGFPGFQWGGDGAAGGGVQFSLGIGVFPFSVMYSFFNNAAWDRRPEPPAQGSRQHQEEHFLNNVFTYIGVFFILWLLLV